MFWHGAESNQKCFVFRQQFTNKNANNIRRNGRVSTFDSIVFFSILSYSLQVHARTYSTWIKMIPIENDFSFFFFFSYINVSVHTAYAECVSNFFLQNPLIDTKELNKKEDQKIMHKWVMWNDTFRWYTICAFQTHNVAFWFFSKIPDILSSDARSQKQQQPSPNTEIETRTHSAADWPLNEWDYNKLKETKKNMRNQAYILYT